jgi:hypothetical protein
VRIFISPNGSAHNEEALANEHDVAQ